MNRYSYSFFKQLKFDSVFGNIKLISEQLIYYLVDVEDRTPKPLVTLNRLRPKIEMACKFLTDKIGAANIGDYLEFGVFRGTSLSCMYETLAKLHLGHVRLFGFDSFAGFPPIAAIDVENFFQPGDYVSTLESTRQCLSEKGIDWSRTFLIKGWFHDTLTQRTIDSYGLEKASVIMIDCDLYTSAKEALNFCKPLIKDVTIFFLDDWNCECVAGERKAFEEFLMENPDLKEELIGIYEHERKPKGRIFSVTKTIEQ